MYKRTFTLFILFILLFPLTALTQSDGIPLQKDVWLESIRNPQSLRSVSPFGLEAEIRNHMDLPNHDQVNIT